MQEHSGKQASVKMLAFGAIGVVYGDIGTSVLYAVKECFLHGGLLPTESNVFGILSLFFWSLFLVVVVKYLHFVLSADNRGEGGILSLLALVTPRFKVGQPTAKATTLLYLGLIGAAMVIADGTITPAITVLSAVEGLQIAAPALSHYILPLTILILVSLFLIQKHGTAAMAKLFAPAMVLWFSMISLSGLVAIVNNPTILFAINPYYAFSFFAEHGVKGFWILGTVVLCITGAEALYADMGHFGRKPIRIAWFYCVMPSLVLNYFGQGALILSEGEAVLSNPFYALTPGWTLYPMLLLATAASIIASQALISGSFSLAQQAVQLGFSPRFTIIHTSEDTKGQIFVPEVNWMLMVVCILLVLMFKSSSGLAAAYGISVTGTMLITTILMYTVQIKKWKWSSLQALSLTAVFLIIDSAFLGANLPKISAGGWLPILMGIILFSIMTTWKRGRMALVKRLNENFLSVPDFVAMVTADKPQRIPGTAVFMTGNSKSAPPALRHHYAHVPVLHERVIVLSIVTDDVPYVANKDTIDCNHVGLNIFEVTAHFGFMQTPKVAKILRLINIEINCELNENEVSFFLGRDVILTDGPEPMATWRKKLFTFLARNSVPATAYFGIPAKRVIELGMQVRL